VINYLDIIRHSNAYLKRCFGVWTVSVLGYKAKWLRMSWVLGPKMQNTTLDRAREKRLFISGNPISGDRKQQSRVILHENRSSPAFESYPKYKLGRRMSKKFIVLLTYYRHELSYPVTILHCNWLLIITSLEDGGSMCLRNSINNVSADNTVSLLTIRQ
jgi:hypothetical protein